MTKDACKPAGKLSRELELSLNLPCLFVQAGLQSCASSRHCGINASPGLTAGAKGEE
jgi:hypothetical protein